MLKLILLMAAALAIFTGCQDSKRTIQTPIGYPTPTPHEKFLKQSVVGENVQLGLPEIVNYLDAEYDWRQIYGPEVLLNNPKTKEPQFTPVEAGVYGFESIVRQGTVISSIVILNVEVTKAPPKIIINSPQSGYFGTDLPINISSEKSLNSNSRISISYSLDGGYSYKEAAINPDKNLRNDNEYLWLASKDFAANDVIDVVLKSQYAEDFALVVLTYDQDFADVSRICLLQAKVWPFMKDLSSQVHLDLTVCQRDIAAKVVDDFRSHIAVIYEDFDQTILLNLPIWLYEHSIAANNRLTNIVELEFFLEKASENIAQIESLTLLAISEASTNLDSQITDAIINSLNELRVITKVRHEYTLARARHVLY